MKGRVLVVDDEPKVVKTLRHILENAGFDVTAAGGGSEAQQALEEEAFDVAVVDLAMPDYDGLQLLAWMREHRPAVAPVVLSGTTSVEDAIEAVQRGAYDFVAKPITKTQAFVQNIERALAHQRLTTRNEELLAELQGKNEELGNRLAQLELAYSVLQSQAAAMQVDLNRARRIQHAQLPKTQPLAGRLAVSVLYRPAAKVGGDLYDFFQLDDRRFGVYVADASGHGVSAAMLTVFLKQAIQPFDHGKPADPGAVLSALNGMFFDEAFGHDMFISMTYLVLDAETLEGRFANAGHPALAVRRRDGTVESLRRTAPALGLNPSVAYTSEAFALKEHETVVIYTDGVTDARDAAGQFYGKDRLWRAIAEPGSAPAAIVAMLEQDLREFAEETPFGDDIAVVAVGTDPQEEPYRPPAVPEQAGPADEGPLALGSAEVRTARHDERTFIAVAGPGTWREGQRLIDLCREAREAGVPSIVLDLAECPHLDSTCYGVLHTLSSEFEENPACRFEIQNIPRALLRDISELGLTAVLMRFRPDPLPLPRSMRTVCPAALGDAQMGRLLLRAHEALVEADPRNADRFAAVLEVLQAQMDALTSEQDAPPKQP